MKNNKFLAPLLLLAVIALVLVGEQSVTRGQSNNPLSVNNYAENGIVINASDNLGGDILGASGTRSPHGVSADETSPITGELRGTTLNITGTAAFADTDVVFRRSTMGTATSTICALQSHTTATSTLEWGSVQFDVSSTTDDIYAEAAKSVNSYNTTTQIRLESITAATQETFIIATSTAETAPGALVQTNRTFAPGEYLVVRGRGGAGVNADLFTPTGVCSATFRSTE